MVQDAISYLFRKIQAHASPLQELHYPEALLVVREVAYQLGHGRLPCMAKGRVSHIMPQGNGIRQVLVQPERPGNGAGNLGNFQAVGHAGAIMIPRHDINLCLALQPPERFGMKYPVPVPLELGAKAAFLHGRFSLCLAALGSLGRQILILELFSMLSYIHS